MQNSFVMNRNIVPVTNVKSGENHANNWNIQYDNQTNVHGFPFGKDRIEMYNHVK